MSESNTKPQFALNGADHIALLEHRRHSQTHHPPTVSDLRLFDPEWAGMSSILSEYSLFTPTTKAKFSLALVRKANASFEKILSQLDDSSPSTSYYAKFAAMETIRKILHGLIDALLSSAPPGAVVSEVGLAAHMKACVGSAAMGKVFNTFVPWQMDQIIFEDDGAWVEDLRVLQAKPEVQAHWGDVRRVWQVLCARKRAVLEDKFAREREIAKYSVQRGNAR